MKRAAFFSLFLFGILTVASGFFSAASDVPWAGRAHAVTGLLFVVAIVGHVRHSVKAARA
jgi:hypothetical protein